MIVLFSSVTSGKSGKSTLSLNMYKYIKEHGKKEWSCQYITNNPRDCVAENPANVIDEKDLFLSNVGDDVVIDADFDFNLLDWGGHLDSRIAELAGVADLIIIPFEPTGTHEFRQAVENINAFSEYNDNIAIVMNKAKKPEMDDTLQELKRAYDYPVFVIPYSKWFDRLALDQIDEDTYANSTIFDLLKTQKAGQLSQIKNKVLPPVLKLCEFVEKQHD